MHYDVFNGDADGICALIQLRLHNPIESTLVTGVKRDIHLLDKITVNAGDSLTVLDISFEKNSRQVAAFLRAGATVFYVDHHQPGSIPVHPDLTTLINTDSSVCTSLLVNAYLKAKFPLWAVVAAFGDNLMQSAENLACTLELSVSQLQLLKELGVYVNYNGYGSYLDDLHFSPATLYREMVNYNSPLDFIVENRLIFEKLADCYKNDIASAETIKPEYQSESVSVFVLPDTAWARRVSGVFGNQLANQHPTKANAVLCCNPVDGYQVSVRAPLVCKMGADEFCSEFATGGGRRSAAGINCLPKDQLGLFIKKLDVFYSKVIA